MTKTWKFYWLTVLLPTCGSLWADPVPYSILLINKNQGPDTIVGSGVVVIDPDVNVIEGGVPGFSEIISLQVNVGNQWTFNLNDVDPLSVPGVGGAQFPSAFVEPDGPAFVTALWGPVAPPGNFVSDFSQAGPVLELTGIFFNFGSDAYVLESGHGCDGCLFGFQGLDPGSTIYSGTYTATLTPEPSALSFVSLFLCALLLRERCTRKRPVM